MLSQFDPVSKIWLSYYFQLTSQICLFGWTRSTWCSLTNKPSYDSHATAPCANTWEKASTLRSVHFVKIWKFVYFEKCLYFAVLKECPKEAPHQSILVVKYNIKACCIKACRSCQIEHQSMLGPDDYIHEVCRKHWATI